MRESSDEWNVCSECGLRTPPGEPGCGALRDTLFARDFEQPVLYWQYHRLAIDSYCVQHEQYLKSAKSLAAHLCGLCVALEDGNDALTLERIHLWLSTNPRLEKPSFRGSVTIGDVAGIEDPATYGVAVREWARSAWEAYRVLHPIARAWLGMAVSQSARRR